MTPSKKTSKKTSEIYEKAVSWFWVILFISAVLYLKGLLVDMHSQTDRLTYESQKIQAELEREREKNEDLYQEFYAELNKAIDDLIRAFNRGEIPYDNF
ncbi:unnamed protein product [marine sediment metagenome]|uniref:Uncharacterized protein n=1 Tax=marine sediment metagenome TaxID=412755 RepID=X0XJ13_9ZZZZ